MLPADSVHLVQGTVSAAGWMVPPGWFGDPESNSIKFSRESGVASPVRASDTTHSATIDTSDGGSVALLREIHRGPLGTRWLGRCTYATGEVRLVMVLRIPVAVLDPEELGRLAAGAAAAVRVSGDFVVRVLDVIRVGNELWSISEHLDGVLVDSLLNGVGTSSPLPLPVALRIAWDLTQAALAARAEMGSPAPERVLWSQAALVTTHGQSRLMDVGLVDRYASCASPRCNGVLVAQLAPEQLDRSVVGDSTEIYAIGQLLWQLLAWWPLPADGSLAQIRRWVLEGSLTPLGSTERGCRAPAPVIAIVDRALQRDPGKRYTSLRQLDEAFSALPHKLVARRPEVAACADGVVPGEASRVRRGVPARSVKDAPPLSSGASVHSRLSPATLPRSGTFSVFEAPTRPNMTTTVSPEVSDGTSGEAPSTEGQAGDLPRGSRPFPERPSGSVNRDEDSLAMTMASSMPTIQPPAVVLEDSTSRISRAGCPRDLVGNLSGLREPSVPGHEQKREAPSPGAGELGDTVPRPSKSIGRAGPSAESSSDPWAEAKRLSRAGAPRAAPRWRWRIGLVVGLGVVGAAWFSWSYRLQVGGRPVPTVAMDMASALLDRFGWGAASGRSQRANAPQPNRLSDPAVVQASPRDTASTASVRGGGAEVSNPLNAAAGESDDPPSTAAATAEPAARVDPPGSRGLASGDTRQKVRATRPPARSASPPPVAPVAAMPSAPVPPAPSDSREGALDDPPPQREPELAPSNAEPSVPEPPAPHLPNAEPSAPELPVPAPPGPEGSAPSSGEGYGI